MRYSYDSRGNVTIDHAVARVGLGQGAPPPAALPSMDFETRSVKDLIETLTLLTRGNEGLDIPAADRKAGYDIAIGIRNNLYKGPPAATLDDLLTLWRLAGPGARKPPVPMDQATATSVVSAFAPALNTVIFNPGTMSARWSAANSGRESAILGGIVARAVANVFPALTDNDLRALYGNLTGTGATPVNFPGASPSPRSRALVSSEIVESGGG